MVGRLPTTLASYVHLPSEALRGDVTRISSLVVKAYARWLADGSPPDEETLDAIARSAALRAEDGFPFDAVVAAYALGLEGIVDRLVQRAGRDDLANVIALHKRVLELIRATTAAVARGYLAEVRTTIGEDRTARRMLLAALLRDESDPVVPAGLSLAVHYLLLSVGIEPHPDASEDGVDPAIVAHRMLRRLSAAFGSVGGEQTLASFDATGGVVLVPVTGRIDWAAWSRVVHDAAAEAGTTIRTAGVATTAAGVGAAAREAAEVLDVVRWLGRPTGLYRLDDVLYEYQLTRPGPARARLAELTGLDLAEADGVARLTAAFAAFNAESR